MDEEMRDALRELSTQNTAGFTRLETKVDGQTNALNQHVLESAVRHAKVEESAKSAHLRIDAHMRGHWWVLGIIGGIISTVGGAIALALFKLMSKTN